MGLRVIHVLTHDSIGLGEDGPTHQPVEHLAALRAIPHLLVFRPCDTVETAECWELALRACSQPSALVLTRQNLPQLRTAFTEENRCTAGAYELLPAEGGRSQVSLFASGSEVAIAAEARRLLAGRGVAARVVSVPCFELLAQAPAEARAAVIGNAPVRVGIEAAIRQGWDAIIGSDGVFVGMTGFGASAPAMDLYRHFGITAERATEAAMAALSKISAENPNER
jgi:transketolase